VDKWRGRLASGPSLDEYESGQLLSDFGLPMNPARRVSSMTQLREAASGLGFPVALKTAVAGILHKTDRGGVHLGIENAQQLDRAYADLAGRLGPEAIIAPMVDSGGVEMLLGLVRDEQFGPLVMLGFGGVYAETLRDVACALPPFDRAAARRLLDGLRLRPLLDAQRGRPAADLDAFCAAAERFSAMAAALGEVLEEVDVNPVVVHAGGCVAVDALVLGRRQAAGSAG
jgi:succinyl-CoA synthetase beta subunit